MSLLTTAEISSIVNDIRLVVSDDVISTSIVLKQSGDTVSTWSPTTQLIPVMWTETGVSAFKGSYTLEEIKESGGVIQYGDLKFIILRSSVTGMLSTDDMVYVSGTTFQSATTYQVVNIVRDPLNIAYFLQCRSC